ncbi:MAG: hypothetical protein MSH29_00235 [Tenericutes bacterium]|nr:hypothetical protein [Mycoplasmatota bacterium]
MINNIINYFESLNGVGQALFIVGVLLVITFIVLLIVVLKPEPKSKKVYGENSYTHSEAELEEKLKDIDNITDDDININNDKTRNLKSIVDELKSVENKNTTLEEMIERYEDEQENTAIISVEELLKKNKPFSYERRETRLPYDNKKDDDDMLFIDDTDELKKITPEDEKKYVKEREVFSSVYTSTNKEEDNEELLNSLKEFRNNL